MRDNNEVAYGGDEEPQYDEDGNLIEFYAIRPNKEQLKRDIAETAKMAEELTHLSVEQLSSMELADNIINAITEAKKMPATKPARKSQMKFITARLREIELDTVIEVLDRIKSKNAHGVREHHQAEQWRDKLIACVGNEVLTELLNQFPDADRQYLRQLQRNAQKEAKAEKPPKSARQLYQYLKQLISDD